MRSDWLVETQRPALPPGWNAQRAAEDGVVTAGGRHDVGAAPRRIVGFQQQPITALRVVLVRHARSAHVTRERWIDAAGVHRWRDEYDAAGIDPSDAPPRAPVELCTTADCLATSDLPRAIASAERLAPGRPRRVSALLRESALEIPTWVPARWPLGVWAACIHLKWLGQNLRGNHGPADDLHRAAAAASWLGELAREASTIVVVTHGVFRRMLGLQLVALGWRAERRVGGYRNWSTWPFERSASERTHAGART